MFAVLFFIAVLIISTMILVFWMSKAPRIEEPDEEEMETRVAAFAARDFHFHSRRVEPKQPKTRGA